MKVVNSPIPRDLYHKVHKLLPLVCVDVVVVSPSKRQFLLIRRKNEPQKGQWWFSGGRIFKNEKLRDAALRKVKQELGLPAKIKKQLGTYEFFSRIGYFKGTNTHMIAVVFLVEVDVDEKIILDWQSSDSRWFTKINRNWNPYLKKYLKEAGFKEGHESH
ncbi:MAG: DUF4916 domain-containing protein [Candidatus Colwellbacteria bacterium]|nr:DUF4916 domain-containing protein [Candidatus Colwellbacteria bacterium]